MDDYIPRKSVYDALCKICADSGACERNGSEGCHKVFADIPAADVVEVVRGEWKHGREISRTMFMNKTLHIDYENWKCSVCRFEVDRLLYNIDGNLVFKFCPNCGADMRGEQ